MSGGGVTCVFPEVVCLRGLPVYFQRWCDCLICLPVYFQKCVSNMFTCVFPEVCV